MTPRFASALTAVCVVAIAGGPLVAAENAKKSADAPPAQKITLEEFDKMRTEPETVVVDVRSAEEFAEGHVPGAINLPIQSDDFDAKIKALDKEKTYLVHCAVGVRSERASRKMTGIVPKLFDFKGGMNEWKKAGKPVEK